MNKTTNVSEQPASDRLDITLMDGRTLSCALKAEQPKVIQSADLQLDITSHYLSIGGKSKSLTQSDEVQAKRQYNHHLFTENAWFLLDNAERIFSDSRMFLSPVNIVNGLAYVGTSPFRNPTLGVYLEWWLNHHEAAVDANGNLVWYISGSPLSGCNCCSSVNPDGRQVPISQRTRFSDIWRSFSEVNNRYNEAKQRCEAYTLEEVLQILRGESYRLRMTELRHEMVEKVMGWKYDKLSQLYSKMCKQFSDFKRNARKQEIREKMDKIDKFLPCYLEKEKEMKTVHEAFLNKRRILKRQLHDGKIEGDYQALLGEASKEYRTLNHELSDMKNDFMLKTFGKNPNEISFAEVLRAYKSLKF